MNEKLISKKNNKIVETSGPIFFLPILFVPKFLFCQKVSGATEFASKCVRCYFTALFLWFPFSLSLSRSLTHTLSHALTQIAQIQTNVYSLSFYLAISRDISSIQTYCHLFHSIHLCFLFSLCLSLLLLFL